MSSYTRIHSNYCRLWERSGRIHYVTRKIKSGKCLGRFTVLSPSHVVERRQRHLSRIPSIRFPWWACFLTAVSNERNGVGIRSWHLLSKICFPSSSQSHDTGRQLRSCLRRGQGPSSYCLHCHCPAYRTVPYRTAPVLRLRVNRPSTVRYGTVLLCNSLHNFYTTFTPY